MLREFVAEQQGPAAAERECCAGIAHVATRLPLRVEHIQEAALELRSVMAADHAIAMHVSAQIRDGGTLQIGIGELGDALVYALLLRHQQHEAWRAALTALGGAGEDLAPFRDGLYACTEMLVDQMLDLMRAGILRRHVYGSLPLMRLLASGRIGERFDGTILEALRDVGVGPRLEACEFEELRRHGVFRSDTRFRDGRKLRNDGDDLS